MNLYGCTSNIVTVPFHLRNHSLQATFTDLPRPCVACVGEAQSAPPAAVKFALSSVAPKFSIYSGLSVKINCLPSHPAAVQININTARAHSRSERARESVGAREEAGNRRRAAQSES
jgi:hypothetical protein